MYSDPTLIRKHIVKLSLNDREARMLEAICEYSGDQKAVMLREMILARAEEVLHGDEFGAAAHRMRGTHDALIAAS